MHKYELTNDSKIVFETPDDGFSYFFGYYDKTALNRSNKRLLAHRVKFDGREVRDGDIADIGYFILGSNEFHKIDETLAWNWQQGAQLQWMPPDHENTIIYNNIVNNKFVSIMYNIETKKQNIIPYPIYAIHPSGKYALGINYERHYYCRPGYNYQNIKNKKWDQPFHKDDGIYKIDLISGDSHLLINISNIVQNQNLQDFNLYNNWLEHILFNPSGDRFMFFHRWRKDQTDHSRVYTADFDTGKELYLYPDTKFYSHYFWKSNEELTIWSIPFNKKYIKSKNIKNFLDDHRTIKMLLRPLYYLMNKILPKRLHDNIYPISKLLNFIDRSDDHNIIGDGLVTGNGHQSWDKKRNNILYDTYQDKKNYRHLMLFNVNNKNIINIGKFYSYYNDSIYRCDLHPRFSLDNRYVSIDSAHLLKRKIIIIDIKDKFKN